MSGKRAETLRVPGCDTPIMIDRDEHGRLVRLSVRGLVYVDARSPERTEYVGLATVDTTALPAGILRHVDAAGERWTERHAWDDFGRITHADGVDMDYDDEGRIIACRGAGGDWIYGYAGPDLAVIAGPSGLRHVVRGTEGQPLAWRDERGNSAEIAYDAKGRRIGWAEPPPGWRFDRLGRLVAVADADGRIVRTLLWDRMHCIGALDGPPGAPLAEVWTLDVTGTPVRRITRSGVTRLPRDAFGEGLLASGTPGLFGGAVHGGAVHLPLRRLDPLTGSFDAPDPINGEAGDPRRAAGWTGPLPVELPAAGPYAVCRNNPVSLADPTGGISDLWWLIPSSLSWSITNTIGSLLGLWLTAQFSPIGFIISAATHHNPFDIEWVKATNYDSFAMRTDGWLAPPDHAFTYQFVMAADEKQMSDLDDARLFAPSGPFRPRLYGSVLLCKPDANDAFVLAGQRAAPNSAALLDWTRAGGAAEVDFFGSRVPVFPAGGLHFSASAGVGAVQRGVKPGPATLAELTPAGIVLTAKVGDFAGFTLSGTGLGLAVDEGLALTDRNGVLSVGRVLSLTEVNGSTIVRSDANLAGLDASALTVDGLTAPLKEQLARVPGRDTCLEISGSSLDYAPSVSVVRLSSGGSVLGADAITALEAQIVLDAGLPTTLAGGTPVSRAAPTGLFDAALGPNANDLTIVSGGVPAVGEAIVVGPAATGIAGVVASVNATVVTLDRPLVPLGAAAAAVKWARLPAAGQLGKLATQPDGSLRLVYTPDAIGTAPNANFVILLASPPVARRVESRDYDAIVLSGKVPGTAATLDVERFRRVNPTIRNIAAAPVATVALSAKPPAGAAAFQLIGFPAAGPGAGATLLAGAAVAAGVATGSFGPGGGNALLRPGEVIALSPGAGGKNVFAQIASVRLTITLDRAIPLTGTAIEAAWLEADPVAYSAERIDDRVLRVTPLVGGNRLDMPRFAVGDLVKVNWGAPAIEQVLTVTGVSGTTITGATDDLAIPAGTVGSKSAGWSPLTPAVAAPASASAAPWRARPLRSTSGTRRASARGRSWR